MLKYLRVVFCEFFPLLWAYFAWILRYSMHPEKYPIEKRFAKVQKLIRHVLKLFHIHYESINVEYIQRKEGEMPRLIVCNHLSNLDPLVFIALMDKPVSFVAKKETVKFPVVGRIIKILDGVFMDRNDLKQSLRIMKQVEKNLSIVDGFDYVIFPEGTRNKAPETDAVEFHHGSFRPGVKSGADILEFALYGTFRVLSKKINMKKFPVEIKYIDKFTKEDYEKTTTPELASKAHDVIVEEVNELRKLDEKLIKELN